MTQALVEKRLISAGTCTGDKRHQLHRSNAKNFVSQKGSYHNLLI
jgi:hypothetical protein